MLWLKKIISKFSEKNPRILWQAEWRKFYQDTVSFYRMLSEQDKKTFEKRALLFIETTEITGAIEVSDEDCLLVAASAIIPVWGFSGWHYFNLKKVFLLPGSFKENFECGKPDSNISGMVGHGPMSGKMALSKPHLHQGFKNHRDKQNVGIHEFVHLIDMADGDCDGFPERLKEFAYSMPWFELVEMKTKEICKRNSNIRDYGASSKIEFLAVASEYFFERPIMMYQKHPKLFAHLEQFYQQDVMAIANDIKIRKKSPCHCGSGRRYKHCCLPED